MNHWGANHCVMTAGHVGHLFITLASLLRIPVYMHNVDRIPRLPPQRLERLRHREPGIRRLSGVSELRPTIRSRLRIVRQCAT